MSPQDLETTEGLAEPGPSRAAPGRGPGPCPPLGSREGRPGPAAPREAVPGLGDGCGRTPSRLNGRQRRRAGRTQHRRRGAGPGPPRQPRTPRGAGRSHGATLGRCTTPPRPPGAAPPPRAGPRAHRGTMGLAPFVLRSRRPHRPPSPRRAATHFRPTPSSAASPRPRHVTRGPIASRARPAGSGAAVAPRPARPDQWEPAPPPDARPARRRGPMGARGGGV